MITFNYLELNAIYILVLSNLNIFQRRNYTIRICIFLFLLLNTNSW